MRSVQSDGTSIPKKDYNCGRRGSPLNTKTSANSSGSLLKIITPLNFLYFLRPLPCPSFTSSLPCFCVPFAIHFAYFVEHLTPTNPSIFFSHVLTDGSVGIVSGRAPVVNSNGQPFSVNNGGGGSDEFCRQDCTDKSEVLFLRGRMYSSTYKFLTTLSISKYSESYPSVLHTPGLGI